MYEICRSDNLCQVATADSYRMAICIANIYGLKFESEFVVCDGVGSVIYITNND